MQKLFPEFLNKGSHGAAVRWLHGYLQSLGLVIDNEELRTLSYGDTTAVAVALLQKEMGFTGDDVDGNFGPGTRKQHEETTASNVDDITSRPGEVTWAKFPRRDELLRWPPEE